MTGKKIFGIILIIASVLLMIFKIWDWWICGIIIVVGIVFLLCKCKKSHEKPVDVKEEVKTEPATEEKPVEEAPIETPVSEEESVAVEVEGEEKPVE